jgi:hypothetical protein
VDPDVDIADEFAVQLYRDLVMAAGRDVGEALVGSDQSPRPGLRVGQVPVLQRVDVGIISVCRERLDVLLPDEAQHQSIGPHREGTAGLDIAHRLRVLPKWSAGQPNFVTPARRPWQAVGLHDARHDEQRCGGARRSDGRGASKRRVSATTGSSCSATSSSSRPSPFSPRALAELPTAG